MSSSSRLRVERSHTGRWLVWLVAGLLAGTACVASQARPARPAPLGPPSIRTSQAIRLHDVPLGDSGIAMDFSLAAPSTDAGNGWEMTHPGRTPGSGVSWSTGAAPFTR